MSVKPEIDYPKKIETLVPDILNLFERRHEPSKENIEWYKTLVQEAVERALNEDPGQVQVPFLRMSSVGKPDRQLWYQMRLDVASNPELFKPLDPKTRLKFLAGDLIEAQFLLFAKEAGHTVECLQMTVDIEGVEGHMDCVIDGVAIDIKSTSSFSFSKFKEGKLVNDDPFGYMAQISGYASYLEETYKRPFRRGFLAVNKDTMEPCLFMVPEECYIDVNTRIKYLKEMLKKDRPPQRCYEEKVEKNGNRYIASGCTYCPFKQLCWGDSNNGMGLRVFRYSNGLKFLTHVEERPRVDEITEQFFKYERQDEEGID